MNIINNNGNKNADINNIQNSINESIKVSIKSENNINNNKDKEDYKSYTKSSTYNNPSQSNDTFNYNNLNDNMYNNSIQIQKSRTCQENEKFQRQSLTIRLNILGRNHLETVLETVSEASNSKIDSSEITDNENEDKKNNNDNKENNDTNDNTGKNETKESGKNKESENINSEQKMQGSDIKINDNDFNVVTKKSLFLSSEKTH